jgi:hypothetical protein
MVLAFARSSFYALGKPKPIFDLNVKMDADA